MKRRQFSTTLLGAGAAALALPGAAKAQGGPIEGRQYIRLSQPVPVSAEPGKFEVIEFFWYGCPHCAAFEPQLEAWVKRLPADVVFRRVPVAFRAEPYSAHQRLFYALETLGLVGAMQRKVFYAIHGERQRLDSPAEISAFATKNGIDAAQLVEAYGSFGTQAKLKRACRRSASMAASSRRARLPATTSARWRSPTSCCSGCASPAERWTHTKSSFPVSAPTRK
jgi:thiol:disulfide interchange protein DsbA